MFDIDLHMRFVRSSMDAFFEFGKASLAAAEAWQNHTQSSPPPFSPLASPFLPQAGAPTPTAAFDAWTNSWNWWLQALTPPLPVPDFWRHSRPQTAGFDWPWPMMPWPMFQWPMPNAMPASVFPGWPAQMMPWSYFQAPMIGMMVSAGMPLNVATPTVRASAAAIDAVSAAQKQWQNIFAAYRASSAPTAAHG